MECNQVALFPLQSSSLYQTLSAIYNEYVAVQGTRTVYHARLAQLLFHLRYTPSRKKVTCVWVWPCGGDKHSANNFHSN